MKFKRKLDDFEATQFTNANVLPTGVLKNGDCFYTQTPEGIQEVAIGDWIIFDDGAYYPMKDVLFRLFAKTK